jgi:hypothetical protein
MDAVQSDISSLGKRTVIDGKTTLDNLHQKQMADMRRTLDWSILLKNTLQLSKLKSPA